MELNKQAQAKSEAPAGNGKRPCGKTGNEQNADEQIKNLLKFSFEEMNF